jgi:uncharacterized protein
MSIKPVKSSGQAPVRIWGLSDFHLNYDSLPRELAFVSSANEPAWLKNTRKIAKFWSETVSPQDIVLIPGDLSSAKTHSDVQRDLAWLAKRSGTTMVISPGNHDHWFGRLQGVQRILRNNQVAIDGNAKDLGHVIVCGARSFETPDDPLQELPKSGSSEYISYHKLKMSLEQAKELQQQCDIQKPIIVLWHHPPFDRWGRPDRVVQLMSDFGVSACVFGHIHTQSQWQSVPQGMIEGIKFACVACDSVAFRPRLIWEVQPDS